MSTRAYRVGLFGEEGVGKSTFFDTAAQAPPRRENGVRKVTRSLHLDDAVVALKLYDLNCVGAGSGGYEERNRMLAHMKSCSGAVVFYDVGSKASFSMLKTHLDDLLALSHDCVLFFVGNRKPGSQREVESEGALEFARGLDGGWAELDVMEVGSVAVVLRRLAEKMNRVLGGKAMLVADSRGNARPALPSLDMSSSKERTKAPTEKPLWLEDESAAACMRCSTAFSQTRRKHHCRNCGFIFCKKCCHKFISLRNLGYKNPKRVCNRCFKLYNTSYEREEEGITSPRDAVRRLVRTVTF